MKSTRPTMKDVAREAGVALGTVSKVMNNIPVGDEYRIRVEEAAERLGYRINTYARGLRTDKSGLVAIIVPSVRHPYFGLLVDAVTNALKACGMQTLLATTEYNFQAENECIRLVYRSKVDGIIALTYNPDIEIDETIPFVSIDRFYTNRVPCVASDNYGGGQLAAEKLVERGAKTSGKPVFHPGVQRIMFHAGSSISMIRMEHVGSWNLLRSTRMRAGVNMTGSSAVPIRSQSMS